MEELLNLALNLMGTFAFGLSGGILAVRKQMDLFGGLGQAPLRYLAEVGAQPPIQMSAPELPPGEDAESGGSQGQQYRECQNHGRLRYRPRGRGKEFHLAKRLRMN